MSGQPGKDGSRINWIAARERLALLAGVLSGESEQTPEEVRRILEVRARALAKPLSTAPVDEFMEALTFGISGERYAVESKYIFASFRLEHLALVPAAAPPLVGLTVWRGDLLTLLDLRIVTGVSARALSDLGWVMVLGDSSPAFGILVDELHAIARLTLSAIRSIPEGLPGTREYVRGVTDEATLVLDAAELIRIHT